MTAASYVMVIDDDEALRDSVCELLEDNGLRAVGFDNAEAALRSLREDRPKPAVILLDLTMPVMSGWRFREEQLRDTALASIPAVVMTASRDIQGIQADDIVYKPVKMGKLLEVVRSHMHAVSAAPKDARVPASKVNLTVGPQSLFAGGGELGRRMAELDWASTELGPVETWPQSLRTCVRIILTSRQPMFVWWGENLINLYNDAYKSIIGGKHPEALGQPASVVWRELWWEIHPRASRAMLANEGTYDEALLLIMERHGYQEETYYTFSYSPVPNDQGGTGGIICANTADTQRIIGERQLALLRELAGRTADARTLDEVCSRTASALATNDRDLPFALLYVISSDRSTFELGGSAGVDPEHSAAFAHAALTEPGVWPLMETLDAHQTRVVELGPQHGRPPAGAWERPPSRAALVPIALSGDTGRAGVLVAGLNPFRLFDESYQGFLELVAGQISASIANAQAYEEERKRAEALAEIDRAKTAFFSNVSHEFRTPLTLMLGPVHDLLTGVHGKLAEEQGREIEVVQRNGLRLQKLVNSLLDFARLEVGRVQASYEATDLPAVTRELASAFEYAFERAGVPLVVDCPPLAEAVFVDRDMWDKIVLNLLSNALKFTFEGSVVISVRDEPGGVALRVKDTGVGIPPEEVARVFERFHRIQGTRSRTHEGSGIGLALVQELAKLHGGQARVESVLGRGSTFTVTVPTGSEHLPKERIGARRTQVSTALGAAPFVEEALRWLPGRSDATHAPHLGRASFAALVEPRPATIGSRILLADDNADMRDYVRRHLERHWTVEAVDNGAEALEAARANPPDIIITDIMMPVLDGFGLLRALRQTEHTRAIPVVMLSARAGEEAKVEGFDAGAEDYLTKPFSARELIARVRTHLELAQARRRLKEDRERLYSFFMQAPVPICVFRGDDLVFELANPLYHQVAGHDDLLGKTLHEGIPETKGQGFDVLLRGVMATGKPFVGKEVPVRLDRDHDGILETVYLDFIYAPIQNELGVIDRAMAVVHDVTEQVQARQSIERSEERFRRLVSQIQAGIAQTDLAGRYTLVNERFREIVGRSEDELKQLRLQDLMHQADLAAFSVQLERLVEQGIGFVVECRYLKPDGSIVWVQSSVSRIEDRDGRPQATAAVVIDITQRKYADQVLIESEERFRNMADHAPVMVWVTEADGRCTFLSQTWYAFTGQTPATGLGFGWSDAVHPEDRPAAVQTFELANQKREAFRLDYRLRRHDGEYRWAIDAAAPRLGPDGAFLGFIGSVIDITERQALEAARVAEMQRAIRFSDMFVGILGHDLRNPLSAITTAAYLLETRAESDKIAKPVRRITASADRMERMIAQLLDFTRVRLGRGIPLTYAEVDLAEIARAAVEELDAVHRDIRLEREGNTVGVWDADRLAQLLSNLIANACQHGSSNAPVLVRVDGLKLSHVELHVINAGTIPSDLLPVIFEPLRQPSEPHVKREGSSGLGLGLYITQQIALAHGGTIEVESNELGGTHFVVRLRRDSSPRDALRDSASVFSVESAT